MVLKYIKNSEFKIATGRSRKETKWKNITITWGELLDKLSNTTKTRETMSEYLTMPKIEQDNIKDVGGFVAGSLKGGRRKNETVIGRSMITLDADFAPADLWEDLEILTTHAMAVYSTHKHTPKKPRLRLIIPLTRLVTPDEYEAVARKLAEEIGIDYFDDTTYEPARLMYWPSTPKDAEYFFRYIDAEALNPDTVLSKYADWTDTSFWPESSRSAGLRRKSADKQGDPLAKTGLIGAFCRTYTVEDAIRSFLPTIYSECDTSGRWTYSGGSSAAGLVIYDDNKYAYSNHATDPISGQLCNAFDLVRIHKFGEFDLDSKEDTPVNRLPSWTKMTALVQSDENVRVQIGLDKLSAAKDDFDDGFKTPDSKSNDWLKKMTTTKSGEFEGTINNILLILKNDPNLNGIGGRDLFRDRYTVQETLPWDRHGDIWTDLDDAALRHYLENVYQLESRNKIIDALAIAFESRAYDPVKDYIESTKWDGIPRVDTLLIKYLGADDNEYTKTVTRKTLIAAVKRVYEPGCKFDYMLTLVGAQGVGKSMFVARLGGEWASDTLTDIKGKEAYEALDGVWLMEMSELAALKKVEREAIKSYISKQEDGYRKAYARNKSINKRRCIFIGTTNDKEFLDDETGGRRFWVVTVDENKREMPIWEGLNGDEVKQVWAEAYILYKQDSNIMHLPPEIAKIAKAVQSEHTSEDSYFGICQTFVDTPLPLNWTKMSVIEHQNYYNATEDFKAGSQSSTEMQIRERVTPIEIWVEGMGKDPASIDKRTARRINNSLEALGWEKDTSPQKPIGFGSQRGYRRPVAD